MSPTRRDLLRSLAGVALATALPAGAIAAALPETAEPEPLEVAPGVDLLPEASAEPWGAREYGDYFQRCMAISFPHYRDLSVEMKSERMVAIDGKRTHIGLTTAEDGETVLFVMSSQPLDECGLKIALNGLAMAFAAE